MSTQKSRTSSDPLLDILNGVIKQEPSFQEKLNRDLKASAQRDPYVRGGSNVQLVPDEGTFRGNVEQGVASTLGLFGGTERRNLQQAQKLAGLGDYLPFTGTGLAAVDFEDARRKRDGTGMLLAGVGAVPVLGPPAKAVGKSAGNFLNKTAQNMRTNIPEFYSGNPLVSVKNFLKEYGEAMPATVKESTNAAAVAKRREYGISDAKLDDALSERGKDADLTAVSINRQLPNNEGTLIEESVIGLNYLDNRVARGDVATLSNNVGNRFRAEGAEEIPESIVARATRHLTDGPHVTDKKGVYEYQFKDPASRSNEGYLEAVGANKAGSTAMRSLHGGLTDVYLKDLNKLRGTTSENISPKDMVEFLQITATLDNKALKLLAGDKQPSVVVGQLLRARAIEASGKPFAKNQAGTEALLKKYNRLVDTKVIKPAKVTDEMGNVVSGRNVSDIKTPEGYLVTQQSFLSRQQELGGMNVFITVDPSNQKVYSMLSDGHDIFGKTPVGGNHLITASPLVESSYKTGTKYDAKQVVSRKTKTNVDAAVKRVEDATGVKRKRGEGADRHALRAMREGKVTPTAADEARAASARGKIKGAKMTGGAGVGAGMLTTYNALSDDEE
jgi:hypothetical protein